MKRILLAILAVAVLATFAPTAAWAQGSMASTQGSLRWGVGVGLLMPMGDYNTIDKPGWVVGGGATYWLSGGKLGVRGDVSYSTTKHDGLSGDTKIIGGMASLVYGLAPSTASARPFVTGGLGFYSVDGGGGSETKLGFGAGAGVAIKAGTGGMRVVFATRFTSVSTDPSLTFLPITVGLTFGK